MIPLVRCRHGPMVCYENAQVQERQGRAGQGGQGKAAQGRGGQGRAGGWHTRSATSGGMCWLKDLAPRL